MVEKAILSTFTLNDMEICYLKDDTGTVGLTIYPVALRDKFILKPDTKIQSLIQVKLQEDNYDKNFTNGTSMFHSQTTQSLTYVTQKVYHEAGKFQVITYLNDKHQNLYTHILEYQHDTNYLCTHAQVENRSGKILHLELFSSFCLSALSPFAKTNPVGKIDLLRFRTKWAMEGRKEQRPIELYDLEESWKPSGLAVEKIGQLGSMPVRRFFPIAGIVDRSQNVTWLTKLQAAASWQIEALRLDDDVILTGGLPDRDYGQWQRTLQPEAHFETPLAYLTVGTGSTETVAARFFPKKGINASKKLPVMFNEWAFSWGKPNMDSVQRASQILKQHDVDTYVIDAGWFADKNGYWETNHGDWVPSKDAFPNGLSQAVNIIHDAGLKAGLWFEMETVGERSHQFQNTDHLLKKMGL